MWGGAVGWVMFCNLVLKQKYPNDKREKEMSERAAPQKNNIRNARVQKEGGESTRKKMNIATRKSKPSPPTSSMRGRWRMVVVNTEAAAAATRTEEVNRF